MFECRDCGVDTAEIGEYYMVRDSVWRSVVPHKMRGPYCDDGGTMLCIGCLEVRLGRRLKRWDFTTAPINSIFTKSERFKERMEVAWA